MLILKSSEEQYTSHVLTFLPSLRTTASKLFFFNGFSDTSLVLVEISMLSSMRIIFAFIFVITFLSFKAGRSPFGLTKKFGGPQCNSHVGVSGCGNYRSLIQGICGSGEAQCVALLQTEAGQCYGLFRTR